jgi:hypothetical protein
LSRSTAIAFALFQHQQLILDLKYTRSKQLMFTAHPTSSSYCTAAFSAYRDGGEGAAIVWFWIAVSGVVAWPISMLLLLLCGGYYPFAGEALGCLLAESCSTGVLGINHSGVVLIEPTPARLACGQIIARSGSGTGLWTPRMVPLDREEGGGSSGPTLVEIGGGAKFVWWLVPMGHLNQVSFVSAE